MAVDIQALERLLLGALTGFQGKPLEKYPVLDY